MDPQDEIELEPGVKMPDGPPPASPCPKCGAAGSRLPAKYNYEESGWFDCSSFRFSDGKFDQSSFCKIAELTAANDRLTKERDLLAGLLDQADSLLLPNREFLLKRLCDTPCYSVTWEWDETQYPTALEAIRAAMKGANDGT